MKRKILIAAALGIAIIVVVLISNGVRIVNDLTMCDEQLWLQQWKISPGESGTLFYSMQEDRELYAPYWIYVDCGANDQIDSDTDFDHLREFMSIETASDSEGEWYDRGRASIDSSGPWTPVYSISPTSTSSSVSIEIKDGAFATPWRVGLSRNTADQKDNTIRVAIDRSVIFLLFAGAMALAMIMTALLCWARTCGQEQTNTIKQNG